MWDAEPEAFSKWPFVEKGVHSLGAWKGEFLANIQTN
jgi:hypothetical protein